MGWFVGTNIGEGGVVRRQFYEEPLNGVCNAPRGEIEQ